MASERLVSGNGSERAGISSEINVTPLIDVLLVLLIIFMVIVPVCRVDSVRSFRLPALGANRAKLRIDLFWYRWRLLEPRPGILSTTTL